MARLSAEPPHPSDRYHISNQPDGVTQKFLLCWPDGQAVETVIMAFRGRYAACISTQAGWLRHGLCLLCRRATWVLSPPNAGRNCRPSAVVMAQLGNG